MYIFHRADLEGVALFSQSAKTCLFIFIQVGLNMLIQKARRFSPTTRLLVQRFVPFPAVGKFKKLREAPPEVDYSQLSVKVAGLAKIALMGVISFPLVPFMM